MMGNHVSKGGPCRPSLIENNQLDYIEIHGNNFTVHNDKIHGSNSTVHNDKSEIKHITLSCG